MSYSASHLNESHLLERRRKLRRNSTKAEQILWQELRNKKLGYVFRRQFSIGIFIVDFYCDTLRLIIELDGPVHDDAQQQTYDKKREEWLKGQNFNIVRYKNDEVLFERERILKELKQTCADLEQKFRKLRIK